MATISLSEYERRIAALEKLNSQLAAEIDRMQPVIKAAIDMKEHGCGLCELQLDIAIDAYESSGGKDGADDKGRI